MPDMFDANKEFPFSTELIAEIEKRLLQYNEGAILNIEAVTSITNLLSDNHPQMLAEFMKYDKLMKDMDEKDKENERKG